MRSWLTTGEVKAMLGVKQPRVSQLVQEGALIVERDPAGRLKYDRVSAETLAKNRAFQKSRSAEDAAEREVLQIEARDRFERERKREAAAEAERRAYEDDLREREVKALEGIYACLRQR